jgi:conjugal transfer pilin signal peptidase TrbI
MATPALRRQVFGIRLTAWGAALALLAAGAWGTWTTRRVLALESREVVTVRLSQIMGDFVAAEARAGRPAEETKRATQAYLAALDASVGALGKDGRTVLVAEAVVAGSAEDVTETVRRDVARRLGAVTDARR